MINGYKNWIYLVCLYENDLIVGVSYCFDNEQSANECVIGLKECSHTLLDLRVVKRALLR